MLKNLGFEKKRLPEMFFFVILAFLVNQIAYFGTRQITGSWYHYDMTTELDGYFPFLPWTIVIYFGCYVFWVISYCLAVLQPREDRDRFFFSENLSKFICIIIFLALPTMTVRPEITGDGFWEWLMRFLYSVDDPDNLFPSIHCCSSWLCWAGVRRRKDLHAGYRYFSLFFVIAICISTLTTKQHVWVDVVAGIALAEICYFVAGIKKLRVAYSKFIDSTLRVLHIKQYS